jgi:hypothetical protein
MIGLYSIGLISGVCFGIGFSLVFGVAVGIVNRVSKQSKQCKCCNE